MLTNLHSAIREGDMEMSTGEKSAMQTLCENQVPLQWRKIWSGPRLATEYMKAVSVRAHEAEKRFQGRSANAEWCENIDFATIFSIESFLASLKIATARMRATSTCRLKLHATFDANESLEEPTVHVGALLIDGATLRGGRLAFTSRRTDDTRTPPFRVTFTSAGATGGLATTDIPIPLYTNASRERAIGRIVVATADAPAEMATYAGVAFVVPDAPL